MDKTEHSHHREDDTEDLEEELRGAFAGETANERDDAGGQVDEVMRAIQAKSPSNFPSGLNAGTYPKIPAATNTWRP